MRKRPITSRQAVAKALSRRGLRGSEIVRSGDAIGLAIFVDPFPFCIIVNNTITEAQTKAYPTKNKGEWLIIGDDKDAADFLEGVLTT